MSSACGLCSSTFEFWKTIKSLIIYSFFTNYLSPDMICITKYIIHANSNWNIKIFSATKYVPQPFQFKATYFYRQKQLSLITNENVQNCLRSIYDPLMSHSFFNLLWLLRLKSLNKVIVVFPVVRNAWTQFFEFWYYLSYYIINRTKKEFWQCYTQKTQIRTCKVLRSTWNYVKKNFLRPAKQLQVVTFVM